MKRIAIFCIVLCLALLGVYADQIPRPRTQSPPGSEPSYAVDLLWGTNPTQGWLDLTPIPIGSSQSTTIEIEIFPREDDYCVWSMGQQGTDSYLALQVNSGRLVVRVGGANMARSVALSPNSPLAVKHRWYTISVIITNINSYEALVSAYVNGVEVMQGTRTRALTSGVRTKAFIGSCQFRPNWLPQGPQTYNGIVDNFRVWNLARSQADIVAFSSHVSTTVDLDNPTGLIAHFPFVEGAGANSVAYAGPATTQFYSASFVNAFWIVKDAGVIHRTCSSAGDPHIAIRLPPGNNADCFDPPHVVGQWQLTSCSDNFIVRTYHAPVRAWNLGEGCDVRVCGATINNAMTVKAFDDIFYIDDFGRGYTKKYLTTAFTALNEGANTLKHSGVRYNYQTSYFTIEVPTAGFLKVDIISLAWSRAGTYLNIYIYHTKACETFGVKGLCAHEDLRVTWNQFMFIDNLTPLPQPEPVPARDFDPCSTLPVAIRETIRSEAILACGSTIDQEKFPEAYADCIFDVCATGDVSIARDINDDGACRLSEILAAQTGASTTPACSTRAQCPNSCSGHGNCTTSGCDCFAGFVGPDCGRPAAFTCFHADFTGLVYPVPAPAWVFSTQTIGTLADTDFHSFWNTWHTEDGVLIYFARVEAAMNQYTYHLFVSNDSPNADGGSYTLSITGPAGWYTDYLVMGTGAAVTPGATTTVAFAWDAFRANGIVFRNIANPATLTVTVSNKIGVRQVAIGTSSLRAELDVLKTPDTFTLSAATCNDHCALETDCEACAANDECGWCRSSGQCFLGYPSGPLNSVCRDWKYSTASNVARRLTSSFGYPVNPDATTAYLPVNATQDLMVDLYVAMGNKETINWDLALILGVSKLTNTDDRTNWIVDFSGLTDVFRLFPTLGFSLGSYNDESNRFTLVNALVDADQIPGDTLRSWVFGLQLNNALNTAATSALASVTNPSFGINWRANTRRMVVIYVDQVPSFGGSFPGNEELRQSLLNQLVLPVFLAANQPTQAAWESVVNNDWGFGLVIPIQADSGDLAFAITKAIQLATSQISLIVDLSAEGHVAEDNYGESVVGLASNMRARFNVPFRAQSAAAKTTNLIAPGFGRAEVTNVLNDMPVATIRYIKLAEDNWDVDYKFNGTVFRLAGSASNGVDPILAQITAIPTRGALYQFDLAGAKPENLVKESDLPAFVTDIQGRVIFLAPPDASAIGDAAFTYFNYRVRDACANSDEVVVRVDVIGENDRPWTQMPAPQGDEDTPIVLNFSYFDREGDDAQVYIVKAPYDVLNTGVEVPRGKLYQYSEAVLTGDLTGAVEIQSGQPAPGNRAIYIPWMNANSEHLPEVLFSQPHFVYNVVETTCCADNSCDQLSCTHLTSWDETVQIFIRAVNDAPVIITESDLTNYNFTATPCFSDCTFLEDNGARFPDEAQPAAIWVGGGDIELDQLTAVITSLELPTKARLIDLTGKSVSVGSVIGPFSAGTLKEVNGDWFPVGTLFPALRFTPGLDENNNANGYYAKFTYKVNDGLLDSIAEKQVIIRITPVNDLPRSTVVTTYTGKPPVNQPGLLVTPHVITYTNTPANYTIKGTDPENDPVTPVVVSCRAAGGVIEYIADNGAITVINCASGATLPTKASGSIWLFRYTPPTDVAEDALQVVSYQLKDGSNDNIVGTDDWLVTIDVVPVNRAPTFTLDLNPPATLLIVSTNVGRGLPLSYGLTLADPDVEAGTMSFDAKLVCLEQNQANCAGEISVADFGLGTLTTVTPTQVSGTGMIFDLQLALQTLTFRSTKVGKYNLTVVVNDLGNLGVCPLAPGENEITRYCPQEAHFIAQLTVDDGGAINTIIIASVAGAAAAAGIAVAAAVATKLNKKAQSAQYTPWEINDMDRGISNPLHESPTVEMTNPLHEGPAE